MYLLGTLSRWPAGQERTTGKFLSQDESNTHPPSLLAESRQVKWIAHFPLVLVGYSGGGDNRILEFFVSELPYIEQLAHLIEAGHPFVTVTLVEAIGSTPQDTGTKMLVTAEGLAFGTIGGGKIEYKAIQQAQDMLSGNRRSPSDPLRVLVDWNLQRDVGMTCGGVVKLFFEAYNVDDWHVVVFGAGHVAQALVRCLLQLDCCITCVDSRAEWLAKLPSDSCLTTVEVSSPEQYVAELCPSDFVVCMTMGHNTDLPILAAIFARGLSPAYLGVIGSRSKRSVLNRDLIKTGLPEESIGDFHCPIGLPIGTNQPAEIAISIVAQMLETRSNKSQIS